MKQGSPDSIQGMLELPEIKFQGNPVHDNWLSQACYFYKMV